MAVKGFSDAEAFEGGDILSLARHYENSGVDQLLVFDLSDSDAEQEAALGFIKEIFRLIDLPLIGGGNIKRLEDVKKLLYAGCQKVFLNFSKQSNIKLLEEASKRFGKEKMAVCVSGLKELAANRALIEEYAAEVLLLADGIAVSEAGKAVSLPVLPILMCAGEEDVLNLLRQEVAGVCTRIFAKTATDLMAIKERAKELGLPVNIFESAMKWETFKCGADGLMPVIIQDFKTMEVLMMAYMNREAFELTVKTGRMTYWSRSRSELWIKGLTSGHFQYLKTLSIDCDKDTLLAKVAQVGAACHTGNRSCFYRDLVKKDYRETNPMNVFEDVFAVIKDRKEHPKEGSYTNYLFDKGIDKILKKVGEEATEIIIAAKNPNPEEIKYEISDFLYHIMVLMAERGVIWEDITSELAGR